MIKKILTLISAAAFITASGCAPKTDNLLKNDNTIIAAHSDVVQLKIEPYGVKVTAGYNVKFEVEGIDAAGKIVILSADWKLIGDVADIGTLNKTQGNEITFTAKNPGKITLEAESENLKATAAIEVVKKQ